jgi:hypothetical protein
LIGKSGNLFILFEIIFNNSRLVIYATDWSNIDLFESSFVDSSVIVNNNTYTLSRLTMKWWYIDSWTWTVTLDNCNLVETNLDLSTSSTTYLSNTGNSTQSSIMWWVIMWNVIIRWIRDINWSAWLKNVKVRWSITLQSWSQYRMVTWNMYQWTLTNNSTSSMVANNVSF